MPLPPPPRPAPEHLDSQALASARSSSPAVPSPDLVNTRPPRCALPYGDPDDTDPDQWEDEDEPDDEDEDDDAEDEEDEEPQWYVA